MPICYEVFGVQICIPTPEDIVNAVSQWIEKNLIPWLQQQLGILSHDVSVIVNEWVSSIRGFGDVVVSSIAKSIFYGFSLGSNVIYSGILEVNKGVLSITNAFNQVITPIQQLPEIFINMVNTVTDYATVMIDTLIRTPQYLATALSPITNAFIQYLEFVGNFWVQFLNEAVKIELAIGQGLVNIGNAINTLFNAWIEAYLTIMNKYYSTILGAIAKIPETLTIAVNMINPANIEKTIVTTMQSMNTAYRVASEQFGTLTELAVETIVEPLLKELLKPIKGEPSVIEPINIMLGLLKGLMDSIVDSLRSVLEYEPPLTPEKAFENTKRYLALLSTFSTTEFIARIIEGVIATIGDIEIFGSHLPGRFIASLQPFSTTIRNLYWNLGFGWLTWAIWGELIRSTITEGLQRYYRARYRTKEPSLAMIQEAYRRGLLNDEQVEQLFAYLGYEDKWFDILKANAWYYLPPGTIQEFYARRLISEDIARELLLQYGVRREYHDYYLITAYRYISTSDVLEAFMRGYVNEEWARQRLAFYGYNDKDIEILLQLISKRLTYSIIFEAYEWGLINEDYMVNYLRQLGYTNEELLLMAEIGKLRAISDEISRLKTAILNVYEIGYLSRDEATRLLIGTKIPQNQAELLVKAKDYEKMYNTITDYVGAVARLFRDEKIDEATFRIMIAPFVQDPEIVESLIAYERSLREKKPAYILPPVFRNRKEYLLAQYNSLQRQFNYLTHLLNDEMDELDFIINELMKEEAEAPEEMKPVIRDELEYFRKIKEQREKYYGVVIGKIAVYLDILRRLLQRYGVEVM